MDDKPYPSEPGTPKSDAQIVGILKNGGGGSGGGAAGNVTPTADTALNEPVPTVALNGHFEKLSAAGGEWPVAANRRKSSTPSVTADMTVASGSGEQNGVHHLDGQNDVNNGHCADEDGADVDDNDSDLDDDNHSLEDPVSQPIRLHVSVCVCLRSLVCHN